MVSRILFVVFSFLASPWALASCEFSIEVGDSLKFSVSEIIASKDCESITISLAHSGKLPSNAMGHNWVLSKNADFQAIAAASQSAGLDNNYVPPGDDRVIAATKIIGGGESDSITFPAVDLNEESYTFFCSFPGHWAVMKGTFRVE